MNDRPLDEYLFPSDGTGWKWDAARWGRQNKVADVIESLTKVDLARYSLARWALTETLCPSQEMSSIDSVQKAKLQSYNLAKGSLTAMQRKMT